MAQLSHSYYVNIQQLFGIHKLYRIYFHILIDIFDVFFSVWEPLVAGRGLIFRMVEQNRIRTSRVINYQGYHSFFLKGGTIKYTTIFLHILIFSHKVINTAIVHKLFINKVINNHKPLSMRWL